MKRQGFIALALLFAGVAGIGCSADVVDDSETEEAEQTLPLNCVGLCVAGYRACVLQTRDYAGCAAERELCKDDCDAATCEPGEPGCCQGQPTCW